MKTVIQTVKKCHPGDKNVIPTEAEGALAHFDEIPRLTLGVTKLIVIPSQNNFYPNRKSCHIGRIGGISVPS